ncbi:unnamed protein product [Onchocerca flexuosa]|uniref:Uncharacterized protein n=1 Tax=Onchocerca flexuosa TaxID=387005 RepID=A0A183GY13_9BILA|nr:unnamed protein product [Onchocerca flexuosa]
MKELRGRADTESDDGISLVGVIVVVTTDTPFFLSLPPPYPLTLSLVYIQWSLLPSFIHSTNICIIPMFRKIASIRSQLRVLELNGAHDKLDEICAPSTDMALSFDRYPLYSVAPCLVKSKVTLHKGRTLVDLWSSHHELFLLQR